MPMLSAILEAKSRAPKLETLFIKLADAADTSPVCGCALKAASGDDYFDIGDILGTSGSSPAAQGKACT